MVDISSTALLILFLGEEQLFQILDIPVGIIDFRVDFAFLYLHFSTLRKLICNVNFHIWNQVKMDISSRDGHVCQVG